MRGRESEARGGGVEPRGYRKRLATSRAIDFLRGRPSGSMERKAKSARRGVRQRRERERGEMGRELGRLPQKQPVSLPLRGDSPRSRPSPRCPPPARGPPGGSPARRARATASVARSAPAPRALPPLPPSAPPADPSSGRHRSSHASKPPSAPRRRSPPPSPPRRPCCRPWRRCAWLDGSLPLPGRDDPPSAALPRPPGSTRARGAEGGPRSGQSVGGTGRSPRGS